MTILEVLFPVNALVLEKNVIKEHGASWSAVGKHGLNKLNVAQKRWCYSLSVESQAFKKETYKCAAEHLKSNLLAVSLCRLLLIAFQFSFFFSTFFFTPCYP
jgi:hypothetical protein